MPENEPKKRKLEEMEPDHGSKCESDQQEVTENEPKRQKLQEMETEPSSNEQINILEILFT